MIPRREDSFSDIDVTRVVRRTIISERNGEKTIKGERRKKASVTYINRVIRGIKRRLAGREIKDISP